ncbi:MAG: hypothetical protein IH939_12975 [Acidobacteria bacterium]|nr:hypothetical protein [Acidobacteriota bacterium]
MKMKARRKIQDKVTLIVLAGLLLGCYATTHRGPTTLDPGQFSGAGGYLRFKGTDAGPDEEPGELIALEGRIGVVRGLDVGYMRTFDISEGVEGDDGIDTQWLDAKFQLSNRGNLLNKPTLALGYGFGNVINFEEPTWVNTLYLTLGAQTEKAVFFYSFRYETFDEKINWIPTWVWEEGFDDIRKAHIIGLEYEITPIFRPVVELGRFYTEDFSDGLNVFTVGMNLYSPQK